MSVPALSVVIPLRDEWESLEPLHRELDAVLSPLPGGAEILFVDDGSRDGSLDRLRDLAQKDPRVRVLSLERPAGQSAALHAGFRAARAPLVATLDADLQNDPADLPRLLAALERADVVTGVRTRRRDSWQRRCAGWLGNRLRNRVTGDPLRDVGCSLRVMRAEPLRRVPAFDGMHRFLPTLLRLQGARVLELPVAHRPRRYGRSKVRTWRRLWRAAPDALAVRWLRSRRLEVPAHEYPAAHERPERDAQRPAPPARPLGTSGNLPTSTRRTDRSKTVQGRESKGPREPRGSNRPEQREHPR